MTSANGPPLAMRDYLPRAAIVWAALCILIAIINIGGILNRRFPDPDDLLRLVQVRDLLAGQGWFDLHQYRIDPPAGTLMHWSRLVDLPLALMIGALTPLVGAPLAEQIAVIAVPFATLGALVLAIAHIMSRFFDRETMTLGCLTLCFSPWVIVQMLPLRIDHHGWQIVCVMAALAGLLPLWRGRGAAWSGATLAAGLSISLELLPIAAAFGGVFALRWLFDRDNRSLPIFLISLAAGLALLFLATRGLADLAMHCDAVSPAHLALFAITGALALGVAYLRPRNSLLLIALLGTAGAAGLGAFLWLAPQCAAGPFAVLDPLTRELWFNHVLEGRPAWHVAALKWVPPMLSGLVALGVLIHLAAARPDTERRWWREYAIVFAGALAGGLLVWRSQGFVGALAAVPLGWLAARMLTRLRETRGTIRQLAIAAAIILVLVPSFPAAIASGLPGVGRIGTGNVAEIGISSCEFRDHAPALAALSAGTIFAPLAIGPAMLEATPHSVVATAHHRAAPAMHDVIRAFTVPAAEARGIVAGRGADYLAICADLPELQLYARKAPEGLAGDLLQGRAPGWLEPVEIGATDGFRLWRMRAPAR